MRGNMKRFLFIPTILILAACQSTQSTPSYCEQNPQASICDINSYSSNALDALFELQDKPRKRAFAMFHSGNGGEAIGYAYGYRAQSDADARALKECNRRLQKMKMTGECQLIDLSSKSGVNYADVQISDLTQNKVEQNWKYYQQNTPLYPVALAKNGISGCAVFEAKVTVGGKLVNPEIIASNNKPRLNKEANTLLEESLWLPVNNETRDEEVKKMRVDYCMGGKSLIEAKALCNKQVQQACSSKL